MGAYAPAAIAPPAGLASDKAFLPGLDMQSVLLNLFKQRQGGYGAKGLNVGGTGMELPGYPQQTPDAGELFQGGLAYGFFDPRWLPPPPPAPEPQRMVDQVAESIKRDRGYMAKSAYQMWLESGSPDPGNPYPGWRFGKYGAPTTDRPGPSGPKNRE